MRPTPCDKAMVGPNGMTRYSTAWPGRTKGFTLMEMIISITVLGLLSVVLVPLITLPVNSYFDAQRRGDLQMHLDVIQSKLEDDLRLALPMSMRVTNSGGVYYLEYLEVRASGRYRDGSGLATAYCPATPAPSCSTSDGNSFATTCAAENCFTTLGDPVLSTGISPVVNSDYVAVVNATSTPYVTGAASPLSRLTAYTAPAPGLYKVTFSNKSFPGASSSRRFYLISQPVTYACNPINGRLTKYWGYAITNAQPTAFAAGVQSAALTDPTVQIVSKCAINVLQIAGTTQSTVSIRLTLAKAPAGQAAETAETLLQFHVKEP